MNTAEQVPTDVVVLLADVSSSGTGAPPCDGPADWSVGGEPPGDVTVWGSVSAALPHACNLLAATGLALEKLPFRAFLQGLSQGRSTETISRYFQQVLYAIGELRGEMIKPASMNTPTKIRNSYRWFSYFRDCIGVIDGTHVTTKVPGSMFAAFCGRKHYTSQNVLAAVNFDMRFTYVLAEWEGSTHDASILADSLSRSDGLQIPDGWGEDEFIEEVVTFDEVETGHGVDACDNDAWKEEPMTLDLADGEVDLEKLVALEVLLLADGEVNLEKLEETVDFEVLDASSEEMMALALILETLCFPLAIK
ncbi:hypothetical protein QYE76_040321 [Lolium multiflorum]|uniref:DDE Tnp4 domain-containing protein n=1 Tax=Lolium multiflorum TaxID=4521 RepID=A0AAD8WVC0_LOLMU|nr:hypothetical protein QYE76_040321 [Lolium multiflorum]